MLKEKKCPKQVEEICHQTLFDIREQVNSNVITIYLAKLGLERY